MKNLIAEVCMWILWKFKTIYQWFLKHILNTRGGFLTIGFILGLTSIIIFYEGKAQVEYIRVGLTYTASVKVVPEIVGDSVSTKSLQSANSPIPNKDNVEDLIARYFQDDAKTAIAVAMCESSLQIDRVGDTHLSKPSIGLFQISQIYHNYSEAELKNPERNCQIAKEIQEKGGWERWTTYRNGCYKKYLTN